LQSADLPEPLIVFVEVDEPTLDLRTFAPDVILVICEHLYRSPSLLGHLVLQNPEMPLILLTDSEHFEAACALAEPYAALTFDYQHHDSKILRQLIHFALRHNDRSSAVRILSEQENLLQNLVNHNADGILVIDHEGIIRFANPAAAALFERPLARLLGMPFGYPLVLGQMTELDIMTQSGSERIAEMRVVQTLWQGRSAYLATLRDVTERIQAQRYLQQRLALESLLATISAQFVSLPIAEVDERIAHALETLGNFIGADRAMLLNFTLPPSPLTITHLWEAPHIVGRFPDVPLEAPYHFYKEVFERQEVLIIPEVQRLPEDHVVRSFLTARGVRTLMAIAMRDQGTLRGCLIFSAVSQARPWHYEDAALLAIAADVFASALRRAEINRTLRESEARLRFAVSNAPIALFTFDSEGVVNFMEGSLLDAHFAELRQWRGYSALGDVFIGAALARVLQGEKQTVVIRPNPTSVLEIRLMPLQDENGQIIGGIGISIDVTERQRAQEAEVQRSAVLKILAEASIALTSSLETERVLETILEYAERLVPCDGSTAILFDLGKGYVSMARGRSSHVTRERWKTLFERVDVRAKIEYIRRTNRAELIPNTDEAPHWIPIEGTEWIKSYIGLPIEIEGQVVGLLNFDSATPNFFTQEHVERLQTLVGYAAIALQNARLYSTIQQNAKDLERHVRRRTLELEAERARLRAILDAIEEGVIFFEMQDIWRATYTNPAFHRLFGYAESEIVGRSVQELAASWPMSESQVSIEQIGQILEREGYWQGEVRSARRDGSRFEAKVAASKVTDLRGRFVGTVILVRDISAEKRLQAQKDRFIANAAHELRTPLTNLKMRLYLLRRQPEAADDHLRVLEQVTRRMQALVEDLLDITRFERGMIALNREQLCLQELIEEVIHVQRPHFEQKQVALHSALAEEALYILADAERLTQVFTNLLVNALNYTQEQGQVLVRLTREAEQAVVDVQDNGIGIDAESLKHVFEPFFRTHLGTQRGTGLGLTIAQEIVQAHGGTIEAFSQVGHGTTMRVRLPLVQQAHTAI
ncbi:MAG: hypothetical protein CUN49_03720, partial [Candidatus Thermofonsia Clade 1 bacterium]